MPPSAAGLECGLPHDGRLLRPVAGRDAAAQTDQLGGSHRAWTCAHSARPHGSGRPQPPPQPDRAAKWLVPFDCDHFYVPFIIFVTLDRAKPKTKPGSNSSELSRLETILSTPKFVTVLASYIFHRFEPLLATLSLKILRSCASRWTNVSLLACLGQDAPLIRDAWLSRLESPLEDVGLIESILRLMTQSVARQPGLMHMLVNGEGSHCFKLYIKKRNQREISLFNNADRCLKVVAHLLELDQLEALRLVHKFWAQSCFPAVEFFKKRPGFWPQLCRSLTSADKEASAARAALVFQMIAAEMYNTAGRVDSELQAVLDQLHAHLPTWSDLVLQDQPTNGDENGQLELLSGWSAFIVMSAHYGPSKEAGLRSRIRHDVLESLTQRVEAGRPAGKLLDKLASLHWMLQLEEKNCGDEIVSDLGRLLIAVADQNLTNFSPRFQVRFHFLIMPIKTRK